MKKSDYEVWQELKQGKEEAITQIMQYYYADLYQYSLKIAGDADLSKDCIQEIFMEIWAKKEKLADVKHIKSYLFKALRRKIIYYKNQKKRELENLEIEFDVVFSHEDFLVQEVNLQERQAKLIEALNRLSKRQREAVYLRFYEGLNYEQIAEIMGITYQPLYNLIYKSLKLLRECMTLIVLIELYFLFCQYK